MNLFPQEISKINLFNRKNFLHQKAFNHSNNNTLLPRFKIHHFPYYFIDFHKIKNYSTLEYPDNFCISIKELKVFLSKNLI